MANPRERSYVFTLRDLHRQIKVPEGPPTLTFCLERFTLFSPQSSRLRPCYRGAVSLPEEKESMSDSLRKYRYSLISSLVAFLLLFEFSNPNLLAQARPNAKDLLRQMTVEEKVAQLSQLPGFPIPEFLKQVGPPEDVIRKYGAGSVLWVSDPKQINR